MESVSQALSRCPPDVNLLSPSSTSPKLLTLHQDLTTWTAWLDACELKMENLQVVELPRMVASAKGSFFLSSSLSFNEDVAEASFSTLLQLSYSHPFLRPPFTLPARPILKS